MHWCIFCELYLLNNDSLEVFCNSLMLMCNRSHSMDLNYGVSKMVFYAQSTGRIVWI